MAKRVLSEKALAHRREVDASAAPLFERFASLDVRYFAAVETRELSEIATLQTEFRAFRSDVQQAMLKLSRASGSTYLGRYIDLDYGTRNMADNIARLRLSVEGAI